MLCYVILFYVMFEHIHYSKGNVLCGRLVRSHERESNRRKGQEVVTARTVLYMYIQHNDALLSYNTREETDVSKEIFDS